jgi:hypothetical protein
MDICMCRAYETYLSDAGTPLCVRQRSSVLTALYSVSWALHTVCVTIVGWRVERVVGSMK